ncbi:MAG: hypothetical protein HYU59_05790 [Magnetospirillum gryphiswaldense]|nr:hypothetical protein [Magnetospirillum gryphiswaldense]
MEMANDSDLLTDETAEPVSGSDPAPRESDRALASKVIRTIREDKRHHERAFKRMKRDMYVATNGHEESWGDGKYSANIVGRHIKQKTASLYAKNPKAVARRRETLDFRLWDENPQTLMTAMQFIQQMQQALAATPPVVQQDPVEVPPPVPPGLVEAQALIADAQSGMHRRQVMKKFGRTLEILFAHALRDQNPVDFKTAMKQVARRACTTGVGYIELGFQREYGPRPESVNKLADYKARLDHLQRLADEVAEGEVEDNDAEMAELNAAVAALQNDQEILLREGLVFDFPASTKVIPDRMCKSLIGFIGADHVTVEYHYTKEKVEEVFGVDLGEKFTPYQIDGRRGDGYSGAPEDGGDDQMELPMPGHEKRSGLVCVWKYYDKPSGLVYYVADGHDGFLREPAAPDIYVDDFWPIRALTFNAVESEDELFPPSDVTLLLDMQREINRSREGLREHRQAARPRWGYPNGALDDEDITRLQTVKAFDAIGLNIDPNTDMGKILQPIPVPGVDPNLYETGPFFTDMQLVAAAQAAQLGGLAKATATESALAADSSATNDSSGVDDLDAFLTWVARSSGQIMLREMSPEKVVAIAGPGATWPGLGDLPAMDLEQIASEVFLEVEAGSSGKPNQAVEIRNWKEMLPFLLQMGGIPPIWLARETLRRLDDRMDLTEAVVEGIPAIVAMNRNAQPATGDAATEPTAQGASGGDKAPPPGGATGTGPAFGSNQM